MSIISDNIKRLRQREDMEQLELAEKIGVSNKTVSSWECGRTEPKMGMIEKMCKVLNCTKSDLLEEQPTIIIANSNTTNSLLKYAELIGKLSPESRKEVLNYIDYQIEKEKKNV